PEPDDPIYTSRHKALAIGVIGHLNRSPVPQGWPDGLSCDRIPQPGGSVSAPGEKRLPTGAEGHRHDRVVMLEGRTPRTTIRHVPESRSAALIPREDDLTVGAKGQGINRTLMLERDLSVSTRSRIPQSDSPIR